MMGPEPGSLSLGAALVAGLAASGHCIGMCGGIAGALAMRNPQGTTGAKVTLALAYNLSRITSYAVAGAIAGLLGRTLLKAVDVAPLSIAFRVLAGLIMLAAAARLLFGWRLLDPLESAGSGLVAADRAVGRPAGPQRRARRRDRPRPRLGLAALRHDLFDAAACSHHRERRPLGAAVMLAFGLGTLPSMVTATVAFERIARSLASRATLRNVAGMLLLAFGLWTAGNALWHGGGRHAGHMCSRRQRSRNTAPQHDHGHPH